MTVCLIFFVVLRLVDKPHLFFFFSFLLFLGVPWDLVDLFNARFVRPPHRSGAQKLQDHFLLPFIPNPLSLSQSDEQQNKADTQNNTPFPYQPTNKKYITHNHSTTVMGKKQFIDRKNARHFHLVHRSQRDPLSRDESAPQRVLKEVIPANLIGKVAIPQEEFDGDVYSDGDEDIFGEHGGEDGINYGTYDREIEAVELLEAPVAAGKKKKSAAKNEE